MVDSHGSIDSVFHISRTLLNGLVYKESSRMNKCSLVFCICVHLRCLINLLLEPDFGSPLF